MHFAVPEPVVAEPVVLRQHFVFVMPVAAWRAVAVLLRVVQALPELRFLLPALLTVRMRLPKAFRNKGSLNRSFS